MVAHDFYEIWNFPNCFGALDGKHFMIRKPSCSGSKYFNYKHFCSLILLALADANYKFLFVDVGAQGRCSDGGVFAQSHLNFALERKAINIPDPEPLPGTNYPFPFCLVADEAFPLREYIMKPFPQRNLSHEQKVYNYRVSRARRCVENAFGIMVNRFRVFTSPICLQPKKVDDIILACCALHNMLRTIAPNRYTVALDDTMDGSQSISDIPGTSGTANNLQPARVGGRRSSTQTAKEYRLKLCEYFNSPAGSVPWQDAMV